MTRDRQRVGWAPLMVLAVAVALPFPAGAQFLPPWQDHYIKGLEAERAGDWEQAVQRFEKARILQPEPRRGVSVPGYGTVDYDPYYHLARCLLHTGAPPTAIRRMVERSRRAGVTSGEDLDGLKQEALRLGRIHPRLPGPGDRPGRRPGTRPGARSDRPPPGGERPFPAPTQIRREPDSRPTPPPITGRLDLSALPAGATVTVDGREYAPGTRSIQLPPGTHEVVVEAGDRVLSRARMEIERGSVIALLVPTPTTGGDGASGPAPSPAPSPAPEATPEAGPPEGETLPVPADAPPFPWLPVAATAAALLLLAVLAWFLLTRRGGDREGDLETGPTVRVRSPVATGGAVFGPYVVEDRLGTGGMATTYRARRVSDGREVALKVPHEHCLADEKFRTRFLREGRLGSQLHHPNIVRILEAAEHEDTPYIVMELIRGTTLRDLLRTAGELPLERALDLVRQTAEALDYAHSKGVIHRDLKPENLMMLPDGRLLVMDFGIARVEGAAGLTATSMVLGTPAYLAPETIAREPADHRVDLYALGVILFEMLEGRLPFAATNPLEQLQAHVAGILPARGELRRPVPDAVWELLARLLARRPDDRFPTAEAVLIHLQALRRQMEGGTSGPAPW